MNITVRHASAFFLSCVLCAPAAHAVDLALPAAARETAARDSDLARVSVPEGAFADGTVPSVQIEGPVQRRAYRLPSQALTPLQIIAPMREQLSEAEYEVLLDCNQQSCGGFDFRFAIEVLPAPNMYVNIRDYHFLSARSGQGDAIMILASAAQSAAYLQIITVGAASAEVAAPTEADDAQEIPGVAPVNDAPSSDLVTTLIATGSVALDSLDFAVGTTALADTTYPELGALAELLASRPGLQIAVVGHTDTVGALDTNITVSRARANAVRTRLIEDYDVNPAQVQAAGMGYLSPRASNLNEAGREANRRVEVMVVREE
ncbi:MAG: OmpA family protein [Pseudomonadota bacterium]